MFKPRVFLLLFLSLLSLSCAAVQTAKPRGPLSITIEPLGVISGETVSFVITINSTTSGQNLRVMIQPPGDMELLEGELQWQGAITAGEPLELSFTGRFSSMHENRVAAIAVLNLGAGGNFSQRASYAFSAGIAAGVRTMPRERKPLGREEERNGRRLQVVPLQQ
jgi:hypothetical protein